MRRFVVSLAVVCALATGCGSSDNASNSTSTKPADTGSTSAPATDPVPTTTIATITERGTLAVGERVETYVDASRPTAANKDYAGADDRTFETVLWYPATGSPSGSDEVPDATVDAPIDTDHGPYPLIVLSHGWTANPQVYQVLGRTWASAGYVVAAPAYPLSNTSAPGGPIIGDVSNQPADATFVLDQVLADATLAPVLDESSIGAAGHSLGAITTFGLAYADCCTDDRIDATIPMAGVAGLVESPDNYFDGPATPLLVIHGTDDTTVPYASSVDAYAKASAPKMFVTFQGGDHIWPYIGGAADDRRVSFQEMTTAWWDHWLKDDANALARVRSAVGTSDPPASLQESL